MGLRMTTNVPALIVRRHLMNATAQVTRSLERLSSGLRINRAADDPAGLAMSEKLKAKIRGLEVGVRNAADGISLLQTADGALGSVHDLLLRMNELTVQARNGTLSDVERGYLDTEFQSLIEEVDRIAVSVEFNGRKLLDGSGGGVAVHLGSGSIGLGLGTDFTAAGLVLDSLTLAGDPDGWAVDPSAAIEAAANAINTGRAEFGAGQNRLESAIRQINNQIENLSAANSRIRDLDYAKEMSHLASAQILQQAAVAMLVQANRAPSLVLQLLGIR